MIQWHILGPYFAMRVPKKKMDFFWVGCTAILLSLSGRKRQTKSGVAQYLSVLEPGQNLHYTHTLPKFRDMCVAPCIWGQIDKTWAELMGCTQSEAMPRSLELKTGQ